MVVAIGVQLARTKDESGGPGPKLHQTRSGLRGLFLETLRKLRLDHARTVGNRFGLLQQAI